MSLITKKGKYGRFLHNILTFFDFIILNGVYLLTCALNPGVSEWNMRIVWLLVNVAYIPSAVWFSTIHKVRTIQMDRVMVSSLRAVGVHALLFISLLYIMGIDSLPWQVFAEFYTTIVLLFLLWWTVSHYVIKRYRRRDRNYCRVVIIGTGPTALRFYEEMLSDAGFGYNFHGFFDQECPPDFPYRHLYRGTIDDFENYIVDHSIEEAYYTLSGENEHLMRKCVKVCDNHMVDFRFVPQISRYLSRQFHLESMGQMPVMVTRNNPLDSVINSTLKRAFDIFVSGTFLLLSPLIFIPVAIAIKMSSPGPIFFKQKRTGYRGKEFLCWKFRTMRVNDAADSKQATRDDPRKTKVGDFLRRTSIDELPQFINVFLGDMSVVGPRPHMLKHTEIYSGLIEKYMVRHIVKPGITGWAQVRGYRGVTEELWQMERRVEHDIWYIEHWTFFLDIKIMIRTVLNALGGEENAY